MRYWWVNQNQTFRQEIAGGYLWSPKLNANNRRNPFYEYMREVSPADMVFSYRDTMVAALGIATSYCRECPKPAEFGNAGPNWSQIGWKVDVRWRQLGSHAIRPRDHLQEISPFIGRIYAPLDQNGNGKQAVYLTEISAQFAHTLQDLIGSAARTVQDVGRDLERHMNHLPNAETSTTEVDIVEWENQLESEIIQNTALSDTVREQTVKARIGQGMFRNNVLQVEDRCRITQVTRPEHLVASHIRPWRDCDSAEQRLDGENGLLLTPTIDHLFDKGFISFENNGRLIVSPVADAQSLRKMSIPIDEQFMVGDFSSVQKQYLDFHRDNILRLAKLPQRVDLA